MVLIFPLTTLRSAEVRTLMDIKPYRVSQQARYKIM